MVGSAICATFGLLLAASAVEGWVPGRDVPPETEEIPFAWAFGVSCQTNAFRVVREDGAEGAVAVVDTPEGPGLAITRTNDKGSLAVLSVAAATVDDERIRARADCQVLSGDPEADSGFLTLSPVGEEDLTVWPLFGGTATGGPRMVRMVNGTSRKYSTTKEGRKCHGRVTPAIVVTGGPSCSVWTDWRIEKERLADEAWKRYAKRFLQPDHTSELVDRMRFEALLEAEPDHTARVVRCGDRVELVVDGQAVPPVIYKGFNGASRKNRFGGLKLQKNGVELQAVSVRFGDVPNCDPPCFWTKRGFDVVGAVDKVRDAMRTATEAKFILSIDVDAYPEFGAEHPDEIWKDASGNAVYGNLGRAKGVGKPPEGCWPWISVSSTVWQEAVKSNLTCFVEALKRTGLSRRVIGVHLTGSHDLQFATPYPDHSEPARRAFDVYRRENGGTGDYSRFIHLAAFRAQEKFARHLKRLLGKPIFVVRWCMEAFGGSYHGAYDIDAFLRSDAIDALCAQQAYERRTPGMAIACRLPLASFCAHGKLFISEFDLRTYGAFAEYPEMRLRGISHSYDFATFAAAHRKLAGGMIAAGMGWWYYDMSGGFYEPDEIAREIGHVVRLYRALPPGPPWHPDVAVVVDEETAHAWASRDPARRDPRVRAYFLDQMEAFAASGVPYDTWLKADFDRSPTLAGRYKKVFCLDDPRQGLLTAAEFRSVAQRNGAYVPADRMGLQVNMNGSFVSVHCLQQGRYRLTLPRRALVKNLKTKQTLGTTDVIDLDLQGGETRWLWYSGKAP